MPLWQRISKDAHEELCTVLGLERMHKVDIMASAVPFGKIYPCLASRVFLPMGAKADILV